MLKKVTIIAITIISLGLCKVNAQQIEVTGMAGYMWVGQLPDVKFGNNVNYTGGLYISPVEGLGIEFNYTRVDTQPKWIRGFLEDEYGSLGDLSTEYFLLQILREQQLSDITVYGLFGLGAGYFKLTTGTGGDFGNTKSYDRLRFAISLGGGMKAYLTDRIALRIQARLMSPISYGGLSIGCGTGGCGTGVSAGSYILSADVQGGLTIVLKSRDNASSFSSQPASGGF